MEQIEVKTPDGSYSLQICEGLHHEAGARVVERLGRVATAAIVTNPTVGAHYATAVAESFEAAGFTVAPVEIPDGERYKTLDTANTLYEHFCRVGLDRHDVVVALGGGVIGDLAGFAAATYMRGIAFIQMPTTLLAMVDASVGGKTGLNLPAGKNLVGVFKQPALVLIDPDTLATLPAAELACGMAEIIKHGVIGASELFERLEKENTGDRALLIEQAVRVKVAVVEQDPFELGDRATLNLGHTFGHAFEKASGFGTRHGEAVAVGLIAAARLAVNLGECHASLVGRIEAVVGKFNLPTRVSGFGVDEVISAMRHDKKKKRDSLRFVIPVAPGSVKIVSGVSDSAVRDAVAAVLDQ